MSCPGDRLVMPLFQNRAFLEDSIADGPGTLLMDHLMIFEAAVPECERDGHLGTLAKPFILKTHRRTEVYSRRFGVVSPSASIIRATICSVESSVEDAIACGRSCQSLWWRASPHARLTRRGTPLPQRPGSRRAPGYIPPSRVYPHALRF